MGLKEALKNILYTYYMDDAKAHVPFCNIKNLKTLHKTFWLKYHFTIDIFGMVSIFLSLHCILNKIR